jgi:hypothetical protein
VLGLVSLFLWPCGSWEYQRLGPSGKARVGGVEICELFLVQRGVFERGCQASRGKTLMCPPSEF